MFKRIIECFDNVIGFIFGTRNIHKTINQTKPMAPTPKFVGLAELTAPPIELYPIGHSYPDDEELTFLMFMYLDYFNGLDYIPENIRENFTGCFFSSAFLYADTDEGATYWTRMSKEFEEVYDYYVEDYKNSNNAK